jgi:hypothetical protein
MKQLSQVRVWGMHPNSSSNLLLQVMALADGLRDQLAGHGLSPAVSRLVCALAGLDFQLPDLVSTVAVNQIRLQRSDLSRCADWGFAAAVRP